MDKLSLPRLDLPAGYYRARIIKHLEFGLLGGPVAYKALMTDGVEKWPVLLIPSEPKPVFDVTISPRRSARIERDYVICAVPNDEPEGIEKLLRKLQRDIEIDDYDEPPFDADDI